MWTERKYLALTRQSLGLDPLKRYATLPEQTEYKAKLKLAKEMLDKFRDLGGVVYVDHEHDRFVLMDEKIPSDKLDEAADIFDGHELITIKIPVQVV